MNRPLAPLSTPQLAQFTQCDCPLLQSQLTPPSRMNCGRCAFPTAGFPFPERPIIICCRAPGRIIAEISPNGSARCSTTCRHFLCPPRSQDSCKPVNLWWPATVPHQPAPASPGSSLICRQTTLPNAVALCVPINPVHSELKLWASSQPSDLSGASWSSTT